jgi:hypothetical protein
MAEAASGSSPIKGNGSNGNGGNLGFEAELFKAADKLRGTAIAASGLFLVAAPASNFL